MSAGYARMTAALVARPKRMMTIYAGLIAATGALFWATPTGFIPAQDQGYFLTVISLPPGSSVERTDAVMRKVADRILPLKGVKGAVMLAGFDGPSQTLAPNSAAAYIPLKSFEDREKLGVTLQGIMNEARKATADINEARLLIVPPPLIQGIGSAGGYRMMVQDRSGQGHAAMAAAAAALIAQANRTAGLSPVYTFYDTASPSIYADIDRQKAELLGVPPARIFEAMQVYLGSAFINDFNLIGRTYRVTAQADLPFRRLLLDLAGDLTHAERLGDDPADVQLAQVVVAVRADVAAHEPALDRGVQLPQPGQGLLKPLSSVNLSLSGLSLAGFNIAKCPFENGYGRQMRRMSRLPMAR